MIEDILAVKSGIQLDIGCGANKQAGFVGLDIQPLPGVDIVHDFLQIPWPLPDECALRIIASHIVEHIPPVVWTPAGTRFMFVEFMNECWRVMKPDGQLALALPYWLSQGYAQDPTHCNPCNEHTWAYFDPGAGDGILYQFYRPKPWKLDYIAWNVDGNMEVIMRKRDE